jgi:hypothetical protein
MSAKSFAQFVGILFNARLETARHWAVRSWGMFLTSRRAMRVSTTAIATYRYHYYVHSFNEALTTFMCPSV